jgi:hypothetical protein
MKKILQELRDNQRRKVLARKSLPNILLLIKKQQFKIIVKNNQTIVLLRNIPFMSIKPTVKFIGNFKHHYSLEQLNDLRALLGHTNKGHRFEELFAEALVRNKNKVSNLNYSAYFSERELQVIKTLQKIASKNKIFKKLKDVDNIASLSGDFISNGTSFSCKKDTTAVKHPRLNKPFSKLWGIDTNTLNEKIILPFNKKFKMKELTKDEFRKISKDTGDLTIAREINLSLLKMMVKYKDKNVLDMYDYLIGKDRPKIVTLRDAMNLITVINTKKIDNPTDLTIVFQNDKFYIHFNNGVSFQRRVRSGLNTTSKARWFVAYKEEWTLINNEIIKSNKKEFKIN